MANDNLQGGCALANELGRQPDETSQQHADRLLDAKRRGVSMDPQPAGRRVVNSEAFDGLDRAAETASYAFALCHAVLDKIESLNDLHGAKGIAPNESAEHNISLATNLCCLQLDQITKLQVQITTALKGWPRSTGHAL